MFEELTNRFERMSEIARLINSSEDLDAILNLIVCALCTHADWSMSSILMADRKTGIIQAVKRFDPYQTADKKIPMRWELATSPVAEVIRSGQPLIIANAMETRKYPTYREDARIRGYRTTVIVPLLATDSAGRAMVISVQSRDSVEVSERELSFLNMVSDFASIAVEKAVRIEAEKKISTRLRRSVESYTSIMRPVIEGGSLPAVVNEINRILETPWLIVDLTTHEIVARTPPASFPHDEVRWQNWVATEGKACFVASARDLDPHGSEKQQTVTIEVGADSTTYTAQVFSLIVDGETVGGLYLFPVAEQQDNLDFLQIQVVRLALSAVLMRSVIGFRSAATIQDEVMRRLFVGEWGNRGDFIARASAVGIMLNQPLQILIIASAAKTHQSTAPKHLLQLTARLVKKLFDGHATVGDGGMMISLLPACNRDNAEFSKCVQQLQAAIELNTSNEWILIISEPCDDLAEFGQMHQRCKRLVTLARSLGVTGLVPSNYFGSLPLLLSMADNVVVEEFLEYTIHRIVRVNPKRGAESLKTLRTFVDCDGRFQTSAEKLSIHVSTLRYRLDKLNERFGIDATCATTRFDLQIAFRLHDLSNLLNSDQ